METINAIWFGDKPLGEVRAACLRSFMRHGYKLVLHCYDKPVDTPEGVELFDASTLMKSSELVRHAKTGSLSLSADIYRYRLLREDMGVYVDADIYCMRQLPEGDFLLGYEADERLNNAVLRIPPKSQFLQDILKASEDPYFIPPWTKKRWRRALARGRKTLGFPMHISKQSWGVIGPRLVTYLVKKHKMEDIVQPIDVLYPLHRDEKSLLFSRGLSLSDIATPRSCTMHLSSWWLDREVLPDTPLYEIISS